MLAGELYDASDPQLTNERRRCRALFGRYNETSDDQHSLRSEILKELMGGYGNGLKIVPPFFCDYGSNIYMGNNVYLNYNCIVLDVNAVHIGDNTLIGPNVQVYTATHPMDYKGRNEGLEFGKPVKIGSDVWIGGSAVICPGVTIGDRSVIGAGSVVVNDIPADTFAAGNPCKVIRRINEDS